MTALASGSHRIRGRATDLQRVWWRHPEIPAAVVAAVAWVYLAADHLVEHGVERSWSFRPAPWAAMVLAMMAPAAVPSIRVVAFDSMWRRRMRSPALFLLTYVVAWTAAAGVVAGLVVAGEQLAGQPFEPGVTVVVALLLAAAAWQFTPSKMRFLRRCHRRTPLAPRGWKADRSVIVYGLTHARACMGTCGFAMAAMFVSVHDLHLMVPLTVILSVERLQPRPKPHLGGYAIAALAVFTAVAAL